MQNTIDTYERLYNYPKGLDPLWWEVNDWANFYKTGFGIDLLHDGTKLFNFSQDKKSVSEIVEAFFGISSSQAIVTDVVTVIYSSKEHTPDTFVKAVGHGQCIHSYYQFCDLRTLNEGWEYSDKVDDFGNTTVYNTIEPGRPFKLNNGSEITQIRAYHPDYVEAFIYSPILPNDLANYAGDVITKLVYPDAVNENGQPRQYALGYDVDWRELIHIMADDWLAHNHEDDYEINLRKNNSWPELNINLFPYGRTNYEQYYIDFFTYNGYWAGLYNIYEVLKQYYLKHVELQEIYVDTWNTIQLMTNNETYMSQYFDSGAYKYWHKDIIDNPEKLLFWFDFFQADQMGIGKFAVSVIGDRPKTINDSTIKVIIYRDTPDVIYCTESEYEYYLSICAVKEGYAYIIIDDDLKSKFNRSIRGKTIHEQADTMLYQYSYYNDNVSISSVPIYYLNPNTIISIKDDLSQIIGYYIMNKIDISLAYNGTMTINAIKSPERIY